MKSMAFSRSIATRLSMTGCIALLFVLATVTAVMSWAATRHARSQVTELMLDRADGVAHSLEAIHLTSRAMVERIYPVFESMVGKEIRLDGTTGQLTANGMALNGNFEAVDRFHAETGGVATIFVRTAEGFQRIATSVRKQDGSRALGTLLDAKGAAYAAVSQGSAFSGRTALFGQAYMTHYRPIKDSTGQVIGAFFIGFEIGTFDAAVEETIARWKFFESGGVYLIDPRNGPQEAVFAAHPTGKGKKVLEVMPEAGPFLQSLATAGHSAVSSPGLLNRVGTDRVAVVRRTAETGTWVVAEVSDGEAMAPHWRTLVPFWTMLGLACLTLGLGLMWMTRRWVGLPLRALSDAATAVAQGDLSRSHTSSRQDEIGQVISAVEAMRSSFVDMLRAVRQSAESIATASSQIASGNQDLSGRTEQAAANLQQTASSMEQFTGTVRHTADSARVANELAAQASACATRGGATMADMVETMSAIEHSARQISEISSVIDGIAFQTNILALNAAVEAARAGEQGRGFAVVATEVRTLAQRSATAAREIKSLIGTSAEKVAAGSQLVRNAGEAMNDIVGNVKQVDAIIAGISTASAEQSKGIVQINSAVGELDQMTQQNAALVEESAAAAQSLREQALKLSAFMSRFKLSPTSSH